MNYNPAVDDYITNAEDFAKPILAHWRTLIHQNCPGVEEAIKWSLPHFEFNGDNMCVMASYKNHCAFTFLKADLMTDPRLKVNKDLKPIQRFLGKITKPTDLPANDEFVAMLKEAMQLNEKGIKVKRDKPQTDKPKVLETPDYLLAALTANGKAKEVFESKSNSFRKEYIIWITDAKTDETRQKRINEALEWIAEGKGRFWKHQK
ncbi:YdeI/OmpD-associated family protein [Mucilaginibacter jinjuensis]|uniref:YdeI/OmpD-associated family protein n=1 Tax=Mucilaginibacter jinjuensis TaxID=1176721 RepID=A0ABY7T6B2_9SPHI|nr:YdeI/OmpD-associated family protein [Mucilaginibacter jinjuensis]WCT11758.1 YdeI/OmpD-associated family protein [Mucilaginibacter jinjuensis]